MGGAVGEDGGAEFLGIVAHPLSAHDVERGGVVEASEVHLTIKQCHHMRNMPGGIIHTYCTVIDCGSQCRNV